MIAVLSGPVHGGKTTLLRKACGEWRAKKYDLAGFLSPAVMEGETVAGYDFLDLDGRVPLPFLRRRGEPGWQRVGPYYILPGALEEASALIGRIRPEQVLVVDEVGPLELSGKGLWPALQSVLSKHRPRALLVVREDILEAFRLKTAGARLLVFRLGEPGVICRMEEALFPETKAK